MSDDIVPRLREGGNRMQAIIGDQLTMTEAADEIERLRQWKELAYQMRNKYWWAMLGKTLKQFDAMHKADWQLPQNVELRKNLEIIEGRHD